MNADAMTLNLRALAKGIDSGNQYFAGRAAGTLLQAADRIECCTAENEQIRNKLREFEGMLRVCQSAFDHLEEYGPGSTCLDGYSAAIRKLLESTS